ncbi:MULTISPECIES: P63C domain-containing protein [unclassified Mucilaginibacter]|uniref:P63C domain-containing protein n=1 Tax=unclassified Mucilaginibacter TaxID=2617802 RepID=UPI002AC8ADC8|nr:MULTISPECIES: P63C domain-containing protein [unclassified Mucilaginibacter]MEB0262551.1 P63C domain-containing protein [Mucilaginibacter sp. 10I4]MEB0278418.1 P63C domain-containing protein [Mucilaginibacter sp. 10B2]MEB0302223.1 P63C domain-containing protein [Mucilaginibacter sp. 5C4]WPX24063.1 P63C domain-containing protein [Mucilaginibacter sp. 5C4]
MELEAVYTGIIKLGEFELPCYVLNNEMRVLSQREVVKFISGGRESGNLNRYLDARAIQAYLPDKFKSIDGDKERNKLIFKAGTGNPAHGIQASDLVDICNAYLKARQVGDLHPSQAKLAEQAELFISACAKTGIDAIVDEVTGFQYFRKANEIQEKFKAYLQEEYRAWALTFPRQFFLQLYKLEGKTPPAQTVPYPKRFGKYVMNFIYDTLDPDIADHLRENNPYPGGIKHHHQMFNDFGYKNLQDHVISVLGIMKASINLEKFKQNIAIAFPNLRTQRAVRLKKQQSLNLTAKAQKETPQQTSLFDFIETINTPPKEEFLERINSTDSGVKNLSNFNDKLKMALNYSPKKGE